MLQSIISTEKESLSFLVSSKLFCHDKCLLRSPSWFAINDVFLVLLSAKEKEICEQEFPAHKAVHCDLW